ncbi:unnamed protein product [Prorocentrum cordatum]|uniref:Uncharacterized protein n=1 Tax=Prorocentrum cordatum TaxID=2364126 RepID=A0ABN9TUN6_9DINO|nr:unnamed protein product [Polarella glacialis]
MWPIGWEGISRAEFAWSEAPRPRPLILRGPALWTTGGRRRRGTAPGWRGARRSAGRAALSCCATHCHLDMILPRLNAERHEDAQKAKADGRPGPSLLASGRDFEGWRASLQGGEQGFDGCVHVACSAGSLETGKQLLAHEGVHGAFGIHPLSAGGWSDDVERRLWDLMGLEKAVALGECGLDYFDKTPAGRSRVRASGSGSGTSSSGS